MNQQSTGTIQIKLIPGAAKNQYVGEEGGCFKIKVSARPVKGKANKALIKFLSDILDVPKNRIQIISGEKSRLKTLRISGLEPDEIQTRLSVYGK